MANSAAPGFIRQTYVSPQGVHHVQLGINFSSTPTAGVEPQLDQRDATSVAAISGWAAFLAEYRKFFDEDTNFGLAEIYRVDPSTEERFFIYGWNVAAQGLAATANVPLGMLTMTYKLTNGGLLRVVMMEGVTVVNQNLAPPYIVDTPFQDITEYLVSGDNIIYGRGNAYPFAPISARSKTSDALRG